MDRDQMLDTINEQILSKQSNNMNFLPDWSKTLTPEIAEKELVDFTWKGPGWYITKKLTILVVPFDRSHDTLWHSKTKASELFQFHMYKTNPWDVFVAIINAPTRVDDRYHGSCSKKR